jgi:dUTP pyrophosphatase|nr:MAG: dUTPase [Bacteriophage sp.]
MEKQIIKIYSETGKVPEYKTSGASGFDLFTTISSSNNCQVFTPNDIEEIDAFDGTEEYIAKEFIEELMPFIDNDISYSIIGSINYIKSIQKAINNKLSEINKTAEKNGGIKYGTLYDYMDDNNIEVANIILPFSHNIINTGCFVQIPDGYEIQIRPRSGIGAKTNMIAHFGTIDSDYRGNIGIIINNPSPNSYIIFPNERLAQGVFAKVEQCEFKKVKSIEELTKTDRGNGGFGSTGK